MSETDEPQPEVDDGTHPSQTATVAAPAVSSKPETASPRPKTWTGWLRRREANRIDVDLSSKPEPERTKREPWWRRPPAAIDWIKGIVALIVAVAGLIFLFEPGCKPQPPPDEIKGTLSDSTVSRASYKRFLQRQHLPIPPDLSDEYLARVGAMVEFHYEIVGLAGKRLAMTWELSDAATNELVSEEASAYDLTPSTNLDAGDWAIWVPGTKPGRSYYVTVTVFKPEGPPYALASVDTEVFEGIPG
jgi:hypothetical protein